MRPRSRVFVLGGGHSPYMGKGHPEFVRGGENPGLEEHLRRALAAAFGASGVGPAEVDRAYVANFLGECFVNQGHLGAMLSRVEPALDGKPALRIEAACASGGAAVAVAVDALQGACDVALVAGVEIETNVRGRDGVDYVARAAHWGEERGLDPFVFPHLFARRAKAWKAAFGRSHTDLARVAVKAYANASANPLAQMRAVGLTLEQADTVSPHNYTFLEDEALRDHIRLFDCTPFTDGASAVLLANAEGLRRLGVAPEACTEIVAYGMSSRPLGGEVDPTRLLNVASAASAAYLDAGLDAASVGVAEVHDCFTITELQMIEAIGFAEPGGAGALLEAGRTSREGDRPVNAGGGLLGTGHPIGATGVRQVVEVHRQLRGLCGGYQVPGSPRVGLSANLGGDDRTAVVMLQTRA